MSNSSGEALSRLSALPSRPDAVVIVTGTDRRNAPRSGAEMSV
jgi:hypothetical protein